MKKVFLLILLHFAFVLYSNAQIQKTFDWTNSIAIIGLQEYNSKHGDFFKKKENTWVKWLAVEDVINYYAYDKKNKKLYVETKHGNYAISLKDNEASYYKNNVPNLKGNKLDEAISAVNIRLEERINVENANIQKRIDEHKAIERQRKLQKEKDDSIKRVRDIEEREAYLKYHKYNRIPVNKGTLYCDFCKKSIVIDDTITSYAANDSRIVWFDMLQGDLSLDYFHAHQGDISSSLKGYEPFKYHYEIFKDSLNEHYNELRANDLEIINSGYFLEYMARVRKKAPNGYFESWGWDNEYSFITFNFTYMNTNKKTIKYIEVFWKALNDVGDVRKTGSFKGTGPVETWQSGSWSWDNSHYYVAGDTSKMRLTKVIITYMDGSKVTIPQAKIMEN